MYVCMYVCMYVYMYVRMYVSIYVCKFVKYRCIIPWTSDVDVCIPHSVKATKFFTEEQTCFDASDYPSAVSQVQFSRFSLGF
jgi:hypothetical protein